MKRKATRKRKAGQRLMREQVGVLKGIRDVMGFLGNQVYIPVHGSPGRFIQCWAMPRGAYSAVTQALDDQGQVWERVSLMDEKMVEGRKVKFVSDSWWQPISMKKRETDETG